MSQAESLCNLQDVKKVIPDRTLFENINLSIGEGDRLGLGGSNGEGKTTLLRIISGAILPSMGSVKHRANLRVGYAPSAENVFFSRLTGQENLTFFANLQNVSNKKLTQEIEQWSERPNFNKALRTHYFLCSSGMKQILNLFRAFLASPDLIVLDEPLQSLDQESCQFITKKIEELKSSAVVLASHQANVLQQVAQQNFVLKEGQLCSP